MDASPEQCVRCMTDVNWQKTWDQTAQDISQTMVGSSLARRIVKVRAGSGPMENVVDMHLGVCWDTLADGSVVFCLHSMSSEDQIFPDAIEIVSSGFLARPEPSSTPTSPLCIVHFLFQLKVDESNADLLTGHMDNLVMWFQTFLRATKMGGGGGALSSIPMVSPRSSLTGVQSGGSAMFPPHAYAPSSKGIPSIGGRQSVSSAFQMPNRNSLGPLDSFQMSVDLTSAYPRLPSFSTLSVPPVSGSQVSSSSRRDSPTSSSNSGSGGSRLSFGSGFPMSPSSGATPMPPPKSFDVDLPPGVTMADYWQGAFGSSNVPIMVVSGDMDKVVFANELILNLLGTTDANSQLVSSCLCASNKDTEKVERYVLDHLLSEIKASKRQFFVHLFTFSATEPKQILLVAEGNVSGCWTREGWFLVIELRPLFCKKGGLWTVLGHFHENNRFETFYESSPLPTAIVLCSGVVLCTNSAFRTFVSLGQAGAVGEPLSSVLKGKSIDDEAINVEEISNTIFTLAHHWFENGKDNVLTEGKVASLSCLNLVRGTSLHNDFHRCFLITFLKPVASKNVSNGAGESATKKSKNF